MIILIVLLSLIIIGILANYSGKLVEYIKLPSLIGMMIFGMIIGPAFLNVVPQATLKIAPVIKDIALVAVLFIGGLGISGGTGEEDHSLAEYGQSVLNEIL